MASVEARTNPPKPVKPELATVALYLTPEEAADLTWLLYTKVGGGLLHETTLATTLKPLRQALDEHLVVYGASRYPQYQPGSVASRQTEAR